MRRGLQAILVAVSLVRSSPAVAQQPDPSEVATSVPRLGLSPGEPLVPSATPSIPFGVHPAESKEFVLDFHGYLLLPMNLGVQERANPAPGQSGTVLHTPPVIPQYGRGFEYTGVIPNPWGQLNFTYGNSLVSATVVMAAGTFSTATSYYDAINQLGVYDARLTVNLTKPVGIPFEVNVGAIIGRYGAMGAYDAGRYGTPLIARTNMVGETITAAYPVGKLQFVIEQGLGGQLATFYPNNVVPAGWNGFANPNVGGSLLNQVHLGLSYAKLLQLGLHYVTGWTQDDQVLSGLIPDGRITVIGADTHLSSQYGHLYLGVAHTQAINAGSVGGVVEVLNARGGPELISEYLGPDSGGNGGLTTYGAQYDVSLSRALFGPAYTGESPDVLVSLFGVATQVSSRDPRFDKVTKLKGGAEVTYDFLSWLGVSERFDHVRLNSSDSTQAFSILSSRILFHTGWKARNEIALQYSYFSDGAHVYARTGYPPVIDPSYNPDLHVLSLIGSIWW